MIRKPYHPESGSTGWKIGPLFTRFGEGYVCAAQVFSFSVREESGAVLQGSGKPVLQLGNLCPQFVNGTASTAGNGFSNGSGPEVQRLARGEQFLQRE
ncbi:hypothetical protein [Deinococcus hopiensis]|nr:hypothetical protein [Deinococcus hopiensis]